MGFTFKLEAIYITGVLLLEYLYTFYFNASLYSHFRTSDMLYRTEVTGHNFGWEIAQGMNLQF